MPPTRPNRRSSAHPAPTSAQEARADKPSSKGEREQDKKEREKVKAKEKEKDKDKEKEKKGKEPDRTAPTNTVDKHLELLIEHFGFNPRAYVDAVVYSANEHLYTIGDSFESFAKDQLGPGKELEAEAGVHQILTLLENAIDHAFDTFELFCLSGRNVFGITDAAAKGIVLEHHRGLDFGGDGDGEVGGLEMETRRLEKEEGEVEKKIKAARLLSMRLHTSLYHVATRLSRSRSLLSEYSLLFSPPSLASSEASPSRPSKRKRTATIKLDANLPPATRAIASETRALLSALDALRHERPLTLPLLPTSTAGSGPTSASASVGGSGAKAGKGGTANQGGGETAVAATAGAEGQDKPWAQGRESYINWEVERLVGALGADADPDGAGDAGGNEEGERNGDGERKEALAEVKKRTEDLRHLASMLNPTRPVS